jgi:iron complex transport system substrate-binding protein
VVPEDAAAPDVPESVTILQQPLDDIYLVASAAMDLFRELDAIGNVRFSGQKADGWYIKEAAAAMEAGEMLYAGKYSMPDYELILSEGCDLAIENTMITHSPEVVEKLESFGIPVFIDYSSYEEHPLGRVEWIKLYGVLLGKEQEAEDAFARQAETLEQLSGEKTTGKTVAFFYLTTNGMVSVRRTGDYIPRMIELAGGTYVFDNLGDDSRRSTVNLSMEEFYAAAKDADILIYNSTVDGELENLDALLEKSPLFTDFQAVKTGQVWCTGADFYQHTMAAGDFMEDLHAIFTGDADREYAYVYQL